jgi:hypothetical protein
MGWTFARIRATEFLRNPDRAMKPVFDKLGALEIFPVKAKKESTKLILPTNELTERVIRRAEELRRAWTGAETPSGRGKESALAAGRATAS